MIQVHRWVWYKIDIMYFVNMMKILIFYLLVLSFTNAKLPTWVDDAYNYCKKDDICSVGIGDNEENAKNDAKSKITRYFESKIQKTEKYKLKRKDFEIYYPPVLDCVNFLENKNENGIYYYLAKLDKKKAKETIVKIIDDMNRKIDTKDRATIKDLIKRRIGFNERYYIVAESYLQFEDIEEIDNDKIKNIYITKATNIYENEINSYVNNFLQKNNKIKIIETSDNIDYTISIFILKSNLFVNNNMKHIYSVKILIKQNDTTDDNSFTISRLGKDGNEVIEDMNKELQIKTKQFIKKVINLP